MSNQTPDTPPDPWATMTRYHVLRSWLDEADVQRATLRAERDTLREQVAMWNCSECGWHHAVDCSHKAERDAAHQANKLAWDALHIRDQALLEEQDKTSWLRQEVLTLREALEEAQEALDNYSDVDDGEYGQPIPNRAMRALTTVCKALGTD